MALTQVGSIKKKPRTRGPFPFELPNDDVSPFHRRGILGTLTTGHGSSPLNPLKLSLHTGEMTEIGQW